MPSWLVSRAPPSLSSTVSSWWLEKASGLIAAATGQVGQPAAAHDAAEAVAVQCRPVVQQLQVDRLADVARHRAGDHRAAAVQQRDAAQVGQADDRLVEQRRHLRELLHVLRGNQFGQRGQRGGRRLAGARGVVFQHTGEQLVARAPRRVVEFGGSHPQRIVRVASRLQQHDQVQPVPIRRCVQPAVALDARDGLVDGGESGLVVLLHRVRTGQHMEGLGRRDRRGPVGVVEQPTAAGVVGHEGVDAARLELALACGLTTTIVAPWAPRPSPGRAPGRPAQPARATAGRTGRRCVPARQCS